MGRAKHGFRGLAAGTVLDSSLGGLKSRPRGLKSRPKRPEGPSESPQERPRRPQESSGRPRRAAREAPRPSQAASAAAREGPKAPKEASNGIRERSQSPQSHGPTIPAHTARPIRTKGGFPNRGGRGGVNPSPKYRNTGKKQGWKEEEKDQKSRRRGPSTAGSAD